MGCVLLKLSLLFLTNSKFWTLFLNAVRIILYVEAHWLFCWHYYDCSVEVKRRISFNYDNVDNGQKEKLSVHQKIELGVTALIVISFTLTAFLVVDYMNSLWYFSLIIMFQSISLICLTIALIRI